MGKTVAVAAVCLTALAAAGENLVKNPGFEQIDAKGAVVGWPAAHDTYSYVSGGGRNGTRALFIDQKDGRYAFPSQTIDLKPGETYVAEAWVRAENLEGRGAGGALAVEWSKKDGGWGGGVYSGGVKGTSAGFRKVKVRVKVPADAGRCTVSPFVTQGMVGKAWFDDLSVVPAERALLGPMVSSAYRNAAYDGEVTFSVSVTATAAEIAKQGLSGRFTFTLADGKAKRVKAPVEKAAAQATVDVKTLALGNAPVQFDLVAANGEVVAFRALPFTRAAQPIRRKVMIGKNHLTFVDGKPFFPLGFYMGPASKANVDKLAASPFNCLMAYAPPSQEQMDYCWKKGVRVIYSIKDAYAGTQSAYRGISCEADETPFVASKVVQFRDHPALLAWYVNDELGLEYVDRMKARRDLVERLDPEHPAWSVLYQVEILRGYDETFDVVGSDPYPIFQSGNPPISQVAEHTRITREAIFGAKAMWQVPQVFDWGIYRKEDVAKTRPPTGEEMRNMTWQFIAEGGNGIVYYSLDCLEQQKAKADPAKHWEAIVGIAKEIESHLPVLLSLDAPPTATSSAPEVSVRAWRKGDATWLLAVNTVRRPASASVAVKGCGKTQVELPALGVSFTKVK